MKRETFLTVLCAVLFAALVTFALFGCGCKATKEGFETEQAATPTLTAQEEELFQDIQSGNLNDTDIQKLVEDGKITEQMVEKFLQYLDKMPDPTEEDEPAPAKKTGIKKEPVVPKATGDEGFEVEAFTGSMFAPVR